MVAQVGDHYIAWKVNRLLFGHGRTEEDAIEDLLFKLDRKGEADGRHVNGRNPRAA
jgi:hypothetical protein